jgi:hypothetical protein
VEKACSTTEINKGRDMDRQETDGQAARQTRETGRWKIERQTDKEIQIGCKEGKRSQTKGQKDT